MAQINHQDRQIPNIPRLKRILKRAWRGRGATLYDVASSVRQLCPTHRIRVPQAHYLEETLDRITAASPWRNWDIDRSSMRGEAIEYGPSLGFVVNDAEIVGAYLYMQAAKYKVGWGNEQATIGMTSVNLDSAELVTTESGSRWFGCMLLDDLLLEVVAGNPAAQIRMVTKDYGHESGYRNLLELPPPPRISRSRVRRLTVYDLPPVSVLRRDAYAELRARIRRKFDQPRKEKKTGVFIRRGSGGDPRQLINAAVVEDWFVAAGFDIIDPNKMSADEIVRRTMNARIIAGVEGSQLSHGIYSVADDGAFLVIQPPDRFALPYKEFTDCLGMDFGFVVGKSVQNGFVVSTNELDQVCNMLDSRVTPA